MQTVSITASQLKDLFEYTEFNTNIWVEDLLEKDTVKSVEIFEDGRIDIHHTGHIENHGIWDIKGRQDFDLLVRLIDSKFGIEGMGLSDIYDGLNDHIDTIGGAEEYCDYCWNDDNARRYAEIEGTEYKPFYEDPERGGDWSWNPQSYKFFFNVDGYNECADYQGLSPREAWEAIQKYNEA